MNIDTAIMKRITHKTPPDTFTCQYVAVVILRRRGVVPTRAAMEVVAASLEHGHRYDERGLPVSRHLQA